MSAAEIVIVCALELLGRSASSFPPIQILEHRPPEASATAVAFADSRGRVIYLIASAQPFSRARAAQVSGRECREPELLKQVAGTLVHEEWHVRNGADERGAYFAQLMALHLLGLGPGTPVYHEIKLAMRAAVAARAAR